MLRWPPPHRSRDRWLRPAKAPSCCLGPSAVAAHPVAVAVDVHDDASVQEAVQHCGGDHGVVVEDLSP